MIRPCEGKEYVFSRVVHAARDVVAVEINCTRVANTDPTITLMRSNWYCLSPRIWLDLGRGMQHLSRPDSRSDQIGGSEPSSGCETIYWDSLPVFYFIFLFLFFL